ncbi:MAG: efflux RND transporter periplasmic adaptor subunit [Tannerellaceae bacterium]
MEQKSNIGLGLKTISLILILTGCSGTEKKETASAAIPVRTILLSDKAHMAANSYVGTVNSSVQADLGFQVPGQVKSVKVTEGQAVRKGQLLAELECDNLTSSYEAAQASLHQAEDGYKRLKALYDNGSLPEVKLVEIQTQLEQAKSIASISAKNLKEARLIAPFDGVITAKRLESGEMVLPATKLFTLSRLKPLEVKVSVPENEIAAITIGSPCTLTVDAAGGRELTGRVAEKNVIANRISHTYEVKIRFDEEPQSVMPGMVCSVSLQGNGNPSVLTLPARVIQMDADGRHFVWCVENGTAHRKLIAVGQLMPQGVEIISGLTTADQVIADGSHKVCEGAQVNPM